MKKKYWDAGIAGIDKNFDFSNEIFEAIDFSLYDFSSSNLDEAKFISCQFYSKDSREGCSFRNGSLRETSFIQCDLSLASFFNADVFGLELINCRLLGANFINARFMNYISNNKWFCAGKIQGCNLSDAVLQGIILEKCDLRENRWNNTDIRGAVFKGADLSGGEFSDIIWTDADFTYSDLRHSLLQGLDLRKVNLTGVKMDTYQISSLISQLGIIMS
ncbi:pentapeptide repeat-containing protein [Xenorhabdus bovienii]|uniref:pentapeptide repeat-containing protein n=1 Tax=Xenorhabdus bovienii TaxID=40576 RepID=UPI00237D02FD|nr:pentapeptide repeat-containing protein [Xenorhabdus bovienii]MDE1482050.1 pentapeptide repeat-containing protein [Xenorhabdus bovienii]MDE9441123.1 pentapeptide repeat-containing protein [Xenorhabdus bovienii]MDE9546573.1 pentapeptide repeat-containing protein [Xenorhabdus bovienii]